jgi:hypothetical protein
MQLRQLGLNSGGTQQAHSQNMNTVGAMTSSMGAYMYMCVCVCVDKALLYI